MTALGPRWVVVHQARDIALDGWCAVRLSTVRKVVVSTPDSFIARAMRWAGQEAEPVDLDPSSTDHLLRSAARHPLVALHHEHFSPTSCWIGQVQRVSGKYVHLREIDTEAVWTDIIKHRRKTLTLIEVGNLYNQALTAFARKSDDVE